MPRFSCLDTVMLMAGPRLNISAAVAVLLTAACLDPSATQPVMAASSAPGGTSLDECSMLGNILCGAVSIISGDTATDGRSRCVARVESSGRRVEQCVPAQPQPSANPAAKSQQVPEKEAARTARLAWKDNSTNETGFRIYRIAGSQITKIAELGPNTTSYVDPAAPPKSCYVVVAFNSAGESAPTAKVCLPD